MVGARWRKGSGGGRAVVVVNDGEGRRRRRQLSAIAAIEFFFLPSFSRTERARFRPQRLEIAGARHSTCCKRYFSTHHSKAKTHSALPGLPGQGAEAAAGESEDAVITVQPQRVRAVAAARATAVAPSGLDTPANCEGGPPATRWASSEKLARGIRSFRRAERGKRFFETLEE